jgi:hypothetical protein
MTHDFDVTVRVQPHEDGRHCGACQWVPSSGGSCSLFSAYRLALLDESRDQVNEILEAARLDYDCTVHYILGPRDRQLVPWLRCRACLAAQKGNKP